MEISFLGSVAQVRLGAPGEVLPAGNLVEHLPAAQPRLEHPERKRLNQIAELAEFLEKKLITEVEFRHLKADLLTGAPPG